MIEHRPIFVDGIWVDSSATGVIEVFNPVTEGVIATVSKETLDDGDRAVRSAAAGFEAGWQSSVEPRADVAEQSCNRDRGACRRGHEHRAGRTTRLLRQTGLDCLKTASRSFSPITDDLAFAIDSFSMLRHA